MVAGEIRKGFDDALAAEARERTTPGGATAGTTVNIEVDVPARHVERLVAAHVA